MAELFSLQCNKAINSLANLIRSTLSIKRDSI